MALAINKNVPLSLYTTLQVGGPARAFVEVTDEHDLASIIAEARTQALPIKILGGGSNVLVSDDGVAGMVIALRTRGISIERGEATMLLTAAAGELFDDVVAYAVAHELWGLENLSHIPGTTGATPVQNVGAYGVEVADLITAVRVFNMDTMQYEMLTNADCHFGYRDSFFKHEAGARYVVTAVTFALSTAPRPQLTYRDLAERFAVGTPTVREIREAIIAIRAGKFPDWKQVGTAGSFFKNPIITKTAYDALREKYPELPHFVVDGTHVKVPLGWILDRVLQLKGYRVGQVGTYEAQALVLVNHGGATSREIITFAEAICDQVYAATGLTIEWEVCRW